MEECVRWNTVKPQGIAPGCSSFSLRCFTFSLVSRGPLRHLPSVEQDILKAFDYPNYRNAAYR